LLYEAQFVIQATLVFRWNFFVKGGNSMKYETVLVQWVSLLVLFGASVFAEECVFVPTEEQRVLLKEGIEYTKELEKRYSNLTMEGSTEHLDLYNPEEEKHFTKHFRFIRIGHEYCSLEVRAFYQGEGSGESEAFHAYHLINPRASYRFSTQGLNDPPIFVLDEKVKIEDHEHLVGMIDYLVHSNWETGSAPYGMSVDLSCPFDISTARVASPKQGGYIKGITEEVIDGKRMVTLKMGYYYGNPESNGEVSFYRDYYWAMKDAMIEGIRSDTEKIGFVYKTSNIYDFSDTFPKLKKTTLETWDAEGKKLLESEISTITSIDFTVPDVTAFDPKRYISGKQEEDWDTLLPTTRSFTSGQIAGFIIGILLIVWGLGLMLKKTRSAK
jgi:hypothetical protein